MNRTDRINFLKKVAKKSELLGKHNRKTLLKHLEYAKKEFSASSARLREAEAELEKLNATIEDLRSVAQKNRKDITEVYRILQVMELNGADEARIKDESDIAYVIDGRIMHYDSKEDKMIPYRHKDKEEEKKDENASDDGFINFSFDSNMSDDDLLKNVQVTNNKLNNGEIETPDPLSEGHDIKHLG